MNRPIFALPITTVSVSQNKLVTVVPVVAADVSFILMAYALIMAVQG